jgi:hypothetical protein
VHPQDETGAAARCGAGFSAAKPSRAGCELSSFREGRKVNEKPLDYFHEAIRATHGAESELVRRERVVEQFQGETVWEGEVLVFALKGHPSARWCYAWEVDGVVTAVLHEPPVASALDAVRAAISAQ